MIYFPKEAQKLLIGLNITYIYSKRLWLRFIIPLPYITYSKYHDFFENYKGWRILVLKLSFYRAHNYPDRINLSCSFMPIGKQEII